MADRTITFHINGNETLTPAVRAVQNALKSLQGISGKTFARLNAQAKKLDNAKGLLKQIENYHKLQDAIKANVKQQADLRQASAKALQNQQAAQRQLSAMQTAYKQLQQSYRANKGSMSTEAAAAMKAQLQSARAELQAQKQAVKEFGNTYANSNKQINSLQSQLANQQAKLAQLRTTLPTGNIAAAEAALRSQIQATTQALEREISALQRRNQIQQNWHAAQDKLANSWSNFQSSLQTAGTLMSPFTEATKNAMDFEYAMSQVKALTQMRNIRAGDLAKVEEEMAALTAQAKELGATTEFTQTEVANAMSYLGMAGWQKEYIQAAIKPILDLASIAGDHNIARTADVFSDLMTAMSLKPGQMLQVGNKQIEATKHFADATAYALTQSNMNRESYFEAMKYSAPIAATAGLTVGEEIAANMIVASSGLKGSMAGTGMRSGLLTLAGANKKAQQAMQEIDLLSSSDAQKQLAEAEQAFSELGVTGKNFSQRVMQLGQAFSQMGDGNERLNYAYRIFGKNAATFWTKLLADPESLKNFAKYAQEIDSGYAEGWSADTAGVMRENTKTEVEYLNSAWDALSESVGEAFLPAVTAAAQALTQLINKANEWVQQNQTLVQWLGIIAAAISAIVVAAAGLSVISAIVGFLSAGFAMLGTVVSALAGVVAFLASPFFLAIGAVVAFIAVLALVINHADQIKQALSDAWNHPQGAVIGFCELIKSAIGSAVDYVLARWETLKSALSNPFEALTNFMNTGSVVGGNVVNGYDTLTAAPTPAAPIVQPQMPTYQYDYLSNLQAQSVTVNAAQMEQPESTDLSAITEAAQTAAPELMNVTTAAQTAAPELTNVTTAAQTAAPELTNVTTAAQTAAPQITNVGTASTATSPQITAMGSAASASVGNLSALSSAASNAAGSLGGLAGAVSSAIANISAAGASAAAQVRSAAPSAHNAKGGIYSQGAFTTWFAESSPEAAIPIDDSNRAKSLWLQTGSLLGMFDSQSAPVNVVVNLSVSGNADSTSWVEEVRSVFSDLAEEYFGERRRRSFA